VCASVCPGLGGELSPLLRRLTPAPILRRLTPAPFSHTTTQI